MTGTALYRQYEEMMNDFYERIAERETGNNYNVEPIIDYVIKKKDLLLIGNEIIIDCVQIAENAIFCSENARFYSKNASCYSGEFDLGNWAINSKEGDELPGLTTKQERYINNKIQKYLNN